MIEIRIEGVKMENMISFFTETLSGTTYMIVVVIAVILLFACIGYLAERSILRKKKEEQYASVSNQGVTQNIKEPVVNQSVAQTAVPPRQSATLPRQDATLQSATTVVKLEPSVTPVQKSNPVPTQVVPEITPTVNGVKQVVTPAVNTSPSVTPLPQNVVNNPSSNAAPTAIPEIQLPPNTTSQTTPSNTSQ